MVLRVVVVTWSHQCLEKVIFAAGSKTDVKDASGSQVQLGGIV